MNLLLFIAEITAPSSGDNVSVLLWVVTALTAALSAVVIALAAKVKMNETRCLSQETECRSEAKAAHEKIEQIYNGISREQLLSATRQEELMITVRKSLDRNTEMSARTNQVLDRIGTGRHSKDEL